MSEKDDRTNPPHLRIAGMKPVSESPTEDYDKKLRRRVEDRIRKDKGALYLVARVLNIE